MADLKELFSKLNLKCNSKVQSEHLTNDSRACREGSVFLAQKGETVDGHRYIAEAIDRGAKAVIYEEDSKHIISDDLLKKADFIPVKNSENLGQNLAPVFYNYPSRNLKIIGITGTNGKTTSTYLIESFLKQIGSNPGVIGTINTRYNNMVLPAANTTPDAVLLQTHLSDMLQQGVDTVIMEVSSHALTLGRVANIEFDRVLFTNITQDHLDFHENMQHYLEAKLKIFNLLKNSKKKHKVVSCWSDTTYFSEIKKCVRDLDLPFYTYNIGCKNPNDFLYADSVVMNINGIHFNLHHEGQTINQLTTNLIGEYNLLNLLGVLSLFPDFINDNFKYPENFINILNNFLQGVQVPGRMQLIPGDAANLYVVDYAHTSDALLNVLKELKKIPHHRIITIFGCGGDRDRKKRPLMGQAAASISDYVIITSDNPRTEDPQSIIKDIMSGIENKYSNYEVIIDREEAIKKGIALCCKNDILLVAGKGHEDYQIIGHEKIQFDDRKIIKKYL